MARDDYFVVVYKILKYLYECLKKGKEPDIYNVITAEIYGISQSYFEYIIAELFESGYIKGVYVFTSLDRNSPCVQMDSAIQIKPKGIEYLQENSTIAKAKNALKEIKEIVPGL